MKTSIHTALRIFAAGAILSIGLSSPVFAGADEDAARLAITRVQANIEMVSKENPAATRDQAFARAQDKLAQAIAAVGNNDHREAKWLADEAALLVDTTAGNAKLAGLESTRAAIARDVDILELELNK